MASLMVQVRLFVDNYFIVGREMYNLSRINKEAIYIKVNNPFLNRNIGRYQLSHIWHKVLLETPDPKLK